MAPDYTFNHTGPAHHNFDRSFVTHFIFTGFLLLFTIPIWVQVVTIYDRLHFHRWIRALFKNFHCIFQVVLGLYQLAQECCSLQEPTHRLQEPTLRTIPLENHRLQNRNQPQDITDILGMTAYEGYVQTPIQTLDSLYVNQPKHFLPLAEEAKRLAEELHKEKQAKQWAGILHEKLLNQSFLDQLNSLQILEQLAPLHLAKEHYPSDNIDILERLRKVDNIPFNQLYYIAENCADRYYSKVIKTFVFLIKRQFVDRQTLLVNTTHSLKFLKEYTNRQAQIWKVL